MRGDVREPDELELSGVTALIECSAEPSEPEKRPGDVPIYVSDCSRLLKRTDWLPTRTARETIAEMAAWIDRHSELRDSHGFGVATAGRG